MKGSELRKTTFEIFHIQGILKNQNKDKTRICKDMSLHFFYSNFFDSTACLQFFLRNLNFLIPVSFKPDGVNLLYLKLRLVDLTDFNLKYLRSTTLRCKDTDRAGIFFFKLFELSFIRY